jgi:anaerobic selenocysteine-containing dehydrogenase
VISIDGSHRNPVTNGFICAKVKRFAERVYGPDRLLHPAVRKGRKGEGKFAPATWDEALERIASEIQRAVRESGAASILPYSHGASNGLLTQDNFDARLWRSLGASRLARTLGGAPMSAVGAALYGKMPSITYQDFPDAAVIVLWGANPSASGIHMIPFIKEAQARGAKLIVVDPRTTPLAKSADVHLAVKPGTDLAVALAFHRHLFASGRAAEGFLREHARGAERLRECAEPWTFDNAASVADVGAAALEQAAELYAARSPALIRCGWGLERNRNGGNAAMAVLALPAVGGKFGVRGGGYAIHTPPASGVDRPWIEAPDPDTRVINMNHLGRALTDAAEPPISVLFVYNANPAVTAPDQQHVLTGLARENLFTVVLDQVMTDTALYADVILPSTTFLEGYDFVKGYGPVNLDMARPVIDAAGEARSNADVFGELCIRLGVADASASVSELDLLVRVLDDLPAAISNDLREGRVPAPPYGLRPIQFKDVFPDTPGGTIDLFPAALDAITEAGLYQLQGDPATERYPLALISPASERTVGSILGELPRPDAKLTMHPADAAPRGLGDGDLVRVFNDLGEVQCTLAVSLSVRPGTISLPNGLWRRGTRNGFGATALTAAHVTDIGGGPCANDARVQVTSLPVA